MKRSRLSSSLLLLAAIIYLALFIFNTVTRSGRFSPDSMSYINVAQNILAGKGITQPTVGFNQQSFSLDQTPPVPFTEQAPLYPIMVALVSRFGISPARSALLLSAIANAMLLVLVYQLARSLYDETVALIATPLLLFYYPTHWIANWAWTEPIGIAFLLLSLWLLARKGTDALRLSVFAAGLVSGLAFATRFALIPLFGVGILFRLLNPRSWKHKLVETGLYAVGFAIPAGLVLARNFFIVGSLMPPSQPGRTRFWQNLFKVFQTTFGGYLTEHSPGWQIGLLAASVLAICVALALRGDLSGGLRDIFFSNHRYLLALWAATYLIFLIVQRYFSYFDVDARTIAPAGVALVMFWSAAIVRTTKMPTHYARVIALILLLVGISGQARATFRARSLDLQAPIRNSERLGWVATHTSDKDLIIGDDVVDIPFFLHRGSTLSFSPYPYTDYPTYEKIMAYARRYCRDYDNIYLVLRRHSASEEDWRFYLGDFFADLVFGRVQNYPGIIVVQLLNDGCVFRIECR
jgi:4-amino-4-deoxy-L-arabinose transferase-like glycosyltransferase